MTLQILALLRRALWWPAALLGALLVFIAAMAALALHALKPAPGQWHTELRIGPWSHPISMPALIRWSAHPLAAPLLDGRVLSTRFGRWQLQRKGHDIDAVCAPCRVRVAALGAAPLRFARVHVRARYEGADHFAGTLTLAEGGHEALLSFSAQLSRGGAALRLTLAPTPMATVAQVFGHGMPEAARAQVGGTLAFTADARWPEGTWRVAPELREFAVSGLGTERLLHAQLPPACMNGGTGSAPLTGWLPRALIAAEDARFYEHPGYQLEALLDAWQHNQRGAPLRGGSTLTQQLAKFAFTGDDRSAARKLRELLYAAEMERTLGKARILQLYLALAPWGDGVCGAERAARVYLGRPAAEVGPVAAAWLVSLLRNPEAQLQHALRQHDLDRERMQQIVAGMQPMSRAQRARATEQLQDWMPW